MSSVAANVPSTTDLLCEFCGYTLNGLPQDALCPECGNPLVDSLGNQRHAPAWEQKSPPNALIRWITTTAAILFQTRCFYRTFTARGPLDAPLRFARIHWYITSALFAVVAYLHTDWYKEYQYFSRGPLPYWWLLVAFIGSYGLHAGLTALAARLTVLEAAYRGYRLPLATVQRCLYYHAASMLPIALCVAATVIGYRLLLITHPNLTYNYKSARDYLYLLCGEVVLLAFYHFETYWVAMRNVMYANR